MNTTDIYKINQNGDVQFYVSLPNDYIGDNKNEYDRLWTKIDLKIFEDKQQEEQDLINSKKN